MGGSNNKAERDITTILVTALAAFELMIAVAKFPALSFLEFKRNRDMPGHFLNSNRPMCQIQAYVLDVFMLQAVLWNGYLAFNLLRVVVYRDSNKALMGRFWKYFFCTTMFTVLWGLSAALPIWPDDRNRLDSLFGYAKFFCWIQETRYIAIRFIPFVVATLLFIVAVTIKVRRVSLSSSLPPSVYLEDIRSHASGYYAHGVNSGDCMTIFASTFNMAEGAVPPPDQLDQWIPKGHDI
ncbi:hypothetical protein DYB37_002811 [Aphanomyces astaci]|uniref:G-protein coupled receptors family 1 profile domain-containing protein n=1 Tax=Aphanomyces astaci TaxID=112090 RepID=A0A3R7BW60_APHAT|nr:hypothetical protein DYB37_002811 [Aphanomyces astaci]